MRRKHWWIGAAAAVLCMGAMPLDARALGIVEIVFTESGTDAIVAAPGQTITAEIRITADANGISSYGVSVEFNGDLDFLSATELLPAAFSFNLSAGVDGSSESSVATPGRVLTFEAATFGVGAVNVSFLAGTISFRVVAPLNNGPDITTGLYNAGIDGIFDSEGLELETEFRSAAVTPEPGTVLLLGAGIAALTGGRRNRRS